MTITEETANDVSILTIKGNIMGGPDAEVFYNKVKSLIDANQRKIVLDLSGVKLMNSSGLGILIKSLKPVKESGGDFHLANISEKIDSLFMITKLYTVFSTFDTVADATKAFQGK
ncbi:MAG: STAS domain-containing protein [Calditrichaeota bacterium]|nr:STAS domain-containing protein [Candidatus Cloacimonadota bacterium]MCA9786181.1 STAS domain-containing protein [Candidatus Cloacimonadota bacterium]MCB1047023.1 STAS domain-containing protein [Calditrichota bacterium]MCB9472935.1 STAS domain-containing protein [Candidatus Delongbacteria bacterium]